MTTHIRMQSGFSMIEVLLAILVFSLGMVGVTLYTANGLKNSASNLSRATVLRSASLALEPVVNQATNAAELADALRPFTTTQIAQLGQVAAVALAPGQPPPPPDAVTHINGVGMLVRNNHGKDTFIMTAINFQNGDGVAISNIMPAALVSPVTVAFSVPYTRADGNTTTLIPSYTFYFDNTP